MTALRDIASYGTHREIQWVLRRSFEPPRLFAPPRLLSETHFNTLADVVNRLAGPITMLDDVHRCFFGANTPLALVAQQQTWPDLAKSVRIDLPAIASVQSLAALCYSPLDLLRAHRSALNPAMSHQATASMRVAALGPIGQRLSFGVNEAMSEMLRPHSAGVAATMRDYAARYLTASDIAGEALRTLRVRPTEGTTDDVGQVKDSADIDVFGEIARVGSTALLPRDVLVLYVFLVVYVSGMTWTLRHLNDELGVATHVLGLSSLWLAHEASKATGVAYDRLMARSDDDCG